MASTQQEYDASVLSAETDYGNLAAGSIVTNGSQTLEVERVYLDNNTGFKGVLYKDLSTNNYIASFTGTQMTDSGDFTADKQMLEGQVPNQFNSAKDFMESLDGYNIESITGHSLGGSLAQLIGALDEYKDIDVNTFNPYGVEHLLDNLAANV